MSDRARGRSRRPAFKQRVRGMGLTLTAPVRRDIVRALKTHAGPLTTRQLACQLGCSSEQINYQAKVLADYRLIEEMGPQLVSDPAERLWVSLVVDDEVVNTSLGLAQLEDAQLLRDRTRERESAV